MEMGGITFGGSVEGKRCKTCDRVKPLTDFSREGKGYRAECKVCLKIRRQKARARNLCKLIDYVNARGGCVECGETRFDRLQFDHVGRKRFNISAALKLNWAWATILNELQQTEIVCANCHQARSTRQFGYYSYLDPALLDAYGLR